MGRMSGMGDSVNFCKNPVRGSYRRRPFHLGRALADRNRIRRARAAALRASGREAVRWPAPCFHGAGQAFSASAPRPLRVLERGHAELATVDQLDLVVPELVVDVAASVPKRGCICDL